MINKVTNNKEFMHFSSIAKEWWIPNGKFKILHDILPLRMRYILSKIDQKKIKKLNILDLGCGGGLTCEPLARLNANVTGIDFVNENISVAKEHSKLSKLKIKYLNMDIEKIEINEKYDLILLLEVLEHIDNWKDMISKVKKMLKPNGIIIISTINKTILANFFAIFIAENLLKWIPKKTHNYSKLISNKELSKSLTKNNFKIKDITGLNYNPFLKTWCLDKKNYKINYFCTAQIN